MSGHNPKAVLLISGKRKSGKDFCVELLTKHLTDAVVLRIAGPIKMQFAADHGLNLGKLLDASLYKENYRQQMVEYSEQIRAKDPNFFLRLAIDRSKAREKSIWILSDARRLVDIEYFKTTDEFKDSKIVTSRICASIETRVKREWVFTEGIDDKETECGLDSYGIIASITRALKTISLDNCSQLSSYATNL